MKCLILLTVLMSFNASASVYSQATRLSLSVEGKTLKETFKIIENESNFRFFYSDDFHDLSNVISIDFQNKNIDEIMLSLLAQSTVRYKILDNNVIVITPLSNPLTDQQVSITGLITDATSGEPLPGVNISIEGTTIGSISDSKGHYSIEGAIAGNKLVFSFIGYVSQKVTVSDKIVIDIAMALEVKPLDEVVVIGYGTQRKSDLTGSISSVRAKDFQRLSVTRIDQALQGRAAGVLISSNEGSPGAIAKINIRGAGSIGNTDPLWIVDGVRMDPGTNFNMNDIESMEILKDASAAAIYGAQAANGVILVTTKRGKKTNRLNVDFNASIGQRSAVKLYDMLDKTGYVELLTESRQNAGQTPEAIWSDPSSLPNTDWINEIYGKGFEKRVNFSLSDNLNYLNYYLSAGYDNEEGIMIDNSLKRYTIRSNTDFKLTKWLSAGTSLYYAQTVRNPSSDDGADLMDVFRAIPIFPVYDVTNPFGGWGRAPGYFQGNNPVAKEYQNIIENKDSRFNVLGYFDIRPVKGLSIKGNIGVDRGNVYNKNFAQAYNYGSRTIAISTLNHYSSDVTSTTQNIVATYQKSFGKHDLTGMVGYERYKMDLTNFTGTASDFPVPETFSFALATGTLTLSNRTSTIGLRRTVSQFGRLNYNFDNKYFLSSTLRRDGSSRFGQNNLYGIFPSVSLGWKISSEEFLKNNPVISNLKIRASYGILGSDAISDFLYSKSYSNTKVNYIFNASGPNSGTKVKGFFLVGLPNESVKWEQIVQTDIGFDLGLFEDKIIISSDYYIKKTTDMLIGVPLPGSVGVSVARAAPRSIQSNLGEVENKGFELSATYKSEWNGVTFDISGNVAFNKNNVTKLYQNLFITDGVTRSEVGHTLGSYYGRVVEGIFQSQAEVAALNATAPGGVYQKTGTTAGDLIYKDLNGDKTINELDRTFIGNPWPKTIYALNLNLAYKGFDLIMFIQGVSGVDVYNGNKTYYRSFYSDYNSSVKAYERWTTSNPTNHPRLNASDPNGNFSNASSYFVEDGSYLKLRSIQIGYTLPSKLGDKLGASNVRVYLNAQNILTLSGYDGLDPELGGSTNTSMGIDNWGHYPQTKLISAGINVNF